MRALALLLTAGVLAAGCLSTAPGPPPATGADTAWFIGLTRHEAMLDRLDALGAEGVAVEPIGTSVEGRAMHLLRVGRGPFELFLAARHHGNEPTSTEAVLNTVDYLLGRRAPEADALPITHELAAHRDVLLERLTLVIVPMVNPDGAEAYRRTNANGQDLNRDYLLFTEPEPRAVRDAFWRVWPDAGLDLHNEGLNLEAGFDYDAFYPEVPRAEDDTQVLSLSNQWRTVREVEASGGRAGGPNENYVSGSLDDPCEYTDRYLPAQLPNSVPVPPPTDDTNPTAYCEGTFDAFLTIRGAPGWTPEAGIGWDDPADPALPWAIRLHEATIASTALMYAGLYDGCTPAVQKFPGSLTGTTTLPIEVRGPGARFQLVWREDLTGYDQNLEEPDLTVRTPSGRMLGPEAHPLGYTETVASDESGGHLATIATRTPQATPYELRVHDCAPHGAALTVARSAGGLRVANAGSARAEVEVQDPLRGEHAVEAPGAEVRVVRGNLGPATVLTWRFSLAPGETRELAYAAPSGVTPGPARWHAHGPAGQVVVGALEERAALPGIP